MEEFLTIKSHAPDLGSGHMHIVDCYLRTKFQ